jgi:hypothetical protein
LKKIVAGRISVKDVAAGGAWDTVHDLHYFSRIWCDKQ